MGFEDILMLSAVEVFGDFNLRWYAQTNTPLYLGGGVLGYFAVVYYLIKSLRSDNVMYVNGMWDGTSALIESLAAYIVLGERLEHTSNYLGLGLVVVGIFLLKH
jgi:multidrug transporter EmrE-like cation transporter